MLVFGGSQGARAINRVVSAYVASSEFPVGKGNAGIELFHQTGPYDFDEVKNVYAKLAADGKDRTVTCVEYIHDMDARYTWADLIVCRAGASTAAEVAACGKAVVFVPLPTAADDHQLKNAKVFENAGAALVIEQKDFNVESLSKAILRFKYAPDLVEQFEAAVRQFATPKSAEVIAQHVVGIVR